MRQQNGGQTCAICFQINFRVLFSTTLNYLYTHCWVSGKLGRCQHTTSTSPVFDSRTVQIIGFISFLPLQPFHFFISSIRRQSCFSCRFICLKMEEIGGVLIGNGEGGARLSLPSTCSFCHLLPFLSDNYKAGYIDRHRPMLEADIIH